MSNYLRRCVRRLNSKLSDMLICFESKCRLSSLKSVFSPAQEVKEDEIQTVLQKLYPPIQKIA